MADTQSSPSSVEAAKLQEAEAFLREGQPENARALCEAVLQLNSRQPRALHLLGLLAHDAGLFQEARSLISDAIAAGPGNAIFHSNLGNVLQDLSQYESAVECYDRALALQLGLAGTHFNRALALEALGRQADAISGYGRAIALNPQSVAAYYKRALALHGG